MIFFLSFFFLNLVVTNLHVKLSTGYSEIDQIIKVLLSTNMFVSGVFGCLFDNTVPGTLEERGMLKWRKSSSGVEIEEAADKTNTSREIYNLPWCLSRVSEWEGTKYIPFLPYYPSVQPVLEGNTTCTTNF